MNERVACGIFRIGRLRVAVPSAFLAEVVPGPFDVEPFPGAGEVVAGIALVRGRPVPVVDFTAWMRPSSDAVSKVAVLAVLEWPGGRVAVRIDEACRVASCDLADDVRVAGEDDTASRIFRRWVVAEGVATGLLDPPTLLGLPGMRHAVADSVPRKPGVRGGTGHGDTVVAFRVGALRFAVEASAVAGAHPVSGFQRHGFPGSPVRGFVRHRESTLAVLDLPAFLGLPPLGGEPEDWKLLLLSVRGRTLACAVSGILGMLRLRPEPTPPPPGLGRPGVVRSLQSLGEDGDAFLIDADRLLGHEELSGVTRIEVQDGNPGRKSEAANRSGFLVYRAGSRQLATPLTGILSVTMPPDEVMAVRSAEPSLLGTFTWHGRSLPLLDLGTLLGQPPDGDDAPSRRVLVAGTASGKVGLRVSEVESLHQAVPVPFPLVPGPRRPGTSADAIPEITRMIRIPGTGRWRNVAVLEPGSVTLPAASAQ